MGLRWRVAEVNVGKLVNIFFQDTPTLLLEQLSNDGDGLSYLKGNLFFFSPEFTSKEDLFYNQDLR